MKKKGKVETKHTEAIWSIDGGSCKCLMSTAVLQEFISVLSMVIEVEEGNEDMISCYNHVGFFLGWRHASGLDDTLFRRELPKQVKQNKIIFFPLQSVSFQRGNT